MGSNGASPMAPPLPSCEDDATRASALARYDTPDQLSPPAAWGRNRVASFERSSPPTPVFLSGSSCLETVLVTDPPSPPAASRVPRPANTTSVSHSFREEINVVSTSLDESPQGRFRLRGELMHFDPYRVFTEGGSPDDAWSRISSDQTALATRGELKALDPPADQPSVSYPSTGDKLVLPTSLVLPRGTFNLRGEMTHVNPKP